MSVSGTTSSTLDIEVMEVPLDPIVKGLLISAEIEEILAVADRVAVMYRGRIMGEMKRGEVDLERLGLMMGGHAA